MPHLIACEDLFKHLEYVDQSMKQIRAQALKSELESYDAMLAGQVPADWRFKEYRKRTIVTLAGEITYIRRIYTEPSGICHAYLDEVLGIRTRKKLAPDAFLWIAKMAADISFRKTARAFFERTGAKISHWLVLQVIREEGELILEELYDRLTGKDQVYPGPLRFSTDTLFVEYDGINIPLQKPVHEPKKLRWLYEHDRHKQSFELKCAVAYMGKNERGQRGGAIHFVSGKAPGQFWSLLRTRIAQYYVPKDILAINVSSDAAGWCKNHALDELNPEARITCQLCPYHVNREIRKAFGVGKKANYIIGLLYEKRAGKVLEILKRIIAHAKKPQVYRDLYNYLKNNITLIEGGRPLSMGTMEGTNAHVYAARMKVWGGAWSEEGALAMALVRAHIASGQELIAPRPDNVMLSKAQVRRRERYEESLFKGIKYLPEAEGKGYEPPQGSIALTTHMASYLYGVLNYT